MGFFSTTCPDCGEKNKRGVKFCQRCGADSQAGWHICSHCWTINKASATFCRKCGAGIESKAAHVPVAQVWNRDPGDFARRFELPDLRGAFKSGFYVETGTRALLLVDGRYVQSLPAGLYTPESPSREKILWDNFPRHATVVAVDAGDAELYVTFPELFAKDKVTVQATVRVIVRISDEAAFFVNEMKDREVYTVHDLAAVLYDELRDGMAEMAGKYDAGALTGNLNMKDEFGTSLELHLSHTLSRAGLSLVQVRSIAFVHAEQELDRERGKLSTYKKRVALWDELRKAASSDKMNKVTTEEQFAAFLRGVDKERLLRTEEMEELQRGFAERKADHNLARDFLIEKLKIEHDLEMRHIALIKEGEMDLMRIDNEIEAERRKKTADMKLWVADKEEKLRLVGVLVDLKHKKEMLRIERAKELSKVSAEVLMTMTDTEKAKLIKDLTRTRLLKDLSEQQVLAMGAAENPDSQLAVAFAEKFKAMEDGKMAGAQKEMYETFFKRLADLQKEAMEMMRDVAKAGAETGKPNVVYPPGGSK
jgi:hypothetical protein